MSGVHLPQRCLKTHTSSERRRELSDPALPPLGRPNMTLPVSTQRLRINLALLECLNYVLLLQGQWSETLHVLLGTSDGLAP